MDLAPLIPALCMGCGAESEPRSIGETPEGWSRNRGQSGAYYCDDCTATTEERGNGATASEAD
jgi:hypothetical protein